MNDQRVVDVCAENPVLTLHAANDLVVPAGPEDVHYAKAAAAGSLDHLL